MAAIKQTDIKQRKTEYMIVGSRQSLANINGDPENKLGDTNI